MRWGYQVPLKNKEHKAAALTISYEMDDDLVTTLHAALEAEGKADGDTGLKVRNMIEFETFLMNANRYRFAVLDEQTLAYLIMNYDTEKEKILGVFKQLASAIAATREAQDAPQNDSLTVSDSENQSENPVNTNEPIQLSGTPA